MERVHIYAAALRLLIACPGIPFNVPTDRVIKIHIIVGLKVSGLILKRTFRYRT